MKIRQVLLWGLAVACAGSMVQAQAARLADGTVVHVRLTSDLLSAQATVGARVDLEISAPVTLQSVVVIPPGAAVWGAVQEVKPGKTLRFDVEGLRLPNQQIVKLRVSPHKTNIAAKDEIKVETQVSGDLGAAKGTDFTVYLDQDVNVDVPETPAAPAQPSPASPAPVASPEVVAAPVVASAPVAVEPPPRKAEAPPASPAPAIPPPAVSAPVAPAATPVAHPAPAAQPGERITVECFSDPLGADILIDDEFHGSTPSILKLVPGNHQIEFRLMGYKPHSQPLNLTPGTGLRTVRMTLEKLP
ncbi:MAG TPA: PEGA domain-containing protein [Terriglobia bacterium]|nr:PEGA domain-containing protein [Terriglobia bacterium]